MAAQEQLLGFVLLAVGGREVDEAVCREAVGHYDVVETVVEAFALCLQRHVLEHLADLRGVHALALAQVIELCAVVVFRDARVQLVAAPLDLDRIAVREFGEGCFEPALSDVAPRASDV